jgi:alpha/beta superfamily hydrolase
MKYCLSFVLIISLFSCSNSESEKEKDYKVGFKTIRISDKARRYKPDVDSANALYYRPVDIDIWYPVQDSLPDSRIVFGDYLRLFEQRANFYTASNTADGLAGKFAQMLSEGFKCSDSAGLLKLPTQTYKNAKAIGDSFPVVIYMASYNGMGYENYLLFETLVRKGFIVISINSIGRFPGDMTMKKEDAMEQVNDAIASVQYLEKNSTMQFNNVGIMGYSWGGLTGALVANKIPNVKCIVSLEGSEFHHYSYAKEEDTDFEGIRNSLDFKKMSLKSLYLRFESSPVNQKPGKDSVNNFLEKVSKGYLILKVDSAEHGDFSAYPAIVKSSGNCKNSQLYKTITKLTSAYLEEHLQGNSVFNKVLEEELKSKSVRKK